MSVRVCLRLSRHLMLRASPQGTRNYARTHKTTQIQSPARVLPIQAQSTPKTKPSWPVDLFKAAKDSGALSISPAASVMFLDKLWSVVQTGRLTQRTIESLLQEHNLDAAQLKIFGKLLTIQRSDIPMTSLGLDLLSVSADLGDHDAAFMLVAMVVDSKVSASIGSSRYQKALSHVKKLASEDKNLQALVLLGKMYEHAQQFKDALAQYETAISVSEQMDVYEDDRTPLAEAYRNAGRLSLIESGKEEIAFHYFETAAREYEDPYSFYTMALMNGEDDPDYFSFLSQAAISGTVEATYELGVWYSKKGDDLMSKKDALHAYSMASYWFELAKDLPKLASKAILHLARIERSCNSESSLVSMPVAVQEAIENVNVPQEIVLSWRKNWSDKDFQLTAAELEHEMDEIKDS